MQHPTPRPSNHSARRFTPGTALLCVLQILTLTMFAPDRSFAQASAAITLPTGWSYVKAIHITEQSGATLTDYQVPLTIDTAALIASGQMNSDGSDIRFATDIGGTQLLHYWIEYGSHAINTATTQIWVRLATLPAATTTTIYMFYGNPSATAASTLTTFDGPYSSTNQVTGLTTGGVTDSQRGFRFSPNQDVLVAQYGKNEPNGTARYVTLFDVQSQSIVYQQQVAAGTAGAYTYDAIPEPFWLTAGQQYILTLYQGPTDGYYFGASTQINSHLTYLDMRYCNGCTKDTFPTNYLNNIHYGTPDFEFYVRNQVSPAPTTELTDVADLSVSLTHGSEPATPGTTISYTLVVSNGGQWDVTGASVSASMPAALSSVDYTSVASGGAAGNTTSGSGAPSDILTLPAGSSISYTIIGVIPPDVTGILVATATVSLPTGVSDPAPEGNTALVTLHPAVALHWYVNQAALGANNGTDWTNAFTALQSALAVAESGDRIWVAAGTYTPGSLRSDSFTLKSGVAVYGGFAGAETQLSQRDWTANVTALSGDIGIGGDASDNSYHVVTGATGATLDGFTIAGGNADGSGTSFFGGGIYNAAASPTLSNLIISGNTAGDGGGGVYNNASSPTLTNITITGNQAGYGGGMYNDNGSSALLTNLSLTGNSAIYNGGGMYNTLSSPLLTNVLLSGNLAFQGGGIYNVSDSSPTLTNVTIAGNHATGQGGGIANNDGDPQIRNSIIWGNRNGPFVSSLWIASGTPVVSYSLVEGGYAGVGNLATDPQFITPADATNAPTSSGDYHLQARSPALDMGDTAALPADDDDLDGDSNTAEPIPLDRDGNPRVANGIVDIGAYEQQDNLPPTLAQPADLSILEDAGAQTVDLTGISNGGGSQTLSFTASSSNPALIPSPTVSYTSQSASGSLSFTSAANAHGSATITLTVQDSGGTNGGGADSLTRSFTVTVTAVNDAPEFTPGANQTVEASAGAQSVASWASGFTPGPADEASQALLGYSIVSNTNADLFSVAPALDESGTLTYTPKPGARGAATIGVVVRDSGGTANGGVDTSAVRTFTIGVGGSYELYLPMLPSAP